MKKQGRGRKTSQELRGHKEIVTDSNLDVLHLSRSATERLSLVQKQLLKPRSKANEGEM
jgi:hypothetical protein